MPRHLRHDNNNIPNHLNEEQSRFNYISNSSICNSTATFANNQQQQKFLVHQKNQNYQHSTSNQNNKPLYSLDFRQAQQFQQQLQQQQLQQQQQQQQQFQQQFQQQQLQEQQLQQQSRLFRFPTHTIPANDFNVISQAAISDSQFQVNSEELKKQNKYENNYRDITNNNHNNIHSSLNVDNSKQSKKAASQIDFKQGEYRATFYPTGFPDTLVNGTSHVPVSVSVSVSSFPPVFDRLEPTLAVPVPVPIPVPRDGNHQHHHQQPYYCSTSTEQQQQRGNSNDANNERVSVTAVQSFTDLLESIELNCLPATNDLNPSSPVFNNTGSNSKSDNNRVYQQDNIYENPSTCSKLLLPKSKSESKRQSIKTTQKIPHSSFRRHHALIDQDHLNSIVYSENYENHKNHESREVERDCSEQTTPSPHKPTTTAAADKDSTLTGISIYPILTKEGYYMSPDLSKENCKNLSSEVNLKCVEQFTVGNQFGKIIFRNFDVRRLNLDDLVTIGDSEISLDTVKVPSCKACLPNCVCVLYDMLPISKDVSIEVFVAALKEHCKENKLDFTNYNPANGDLTFKLQPVL